jgi:hypothetical protein
MHAAVCNESDFIAVGEPQAPMVPDGSGDQSVTDDDYLMARFAK